MFRQERALGASRPRTPHPARAGGLDWRMGSGRRSRRLPPGLQTDLFEADEPRLPSGAVAPGAKAAPLATRMRPAGSR